MTAGQPDFVADPVHVDARGVTAATDREGWIRSLIRAVLFTTPGERVHRADFGSGLLQLVFAPGSPEVASTVQLLVSGALHQWLGHLIEIGAVEVESVDTALHVEVTYTVRSTGELRVDRFGSGGAA
jgi:uncharacterized protein